MLMHKPVQAKLAFSKPVALFSSDQRHSPLHPLLSLQQFAKSYPKERSGVCVHLSNKRLSGVF